MSELRAAVIGCGEPDEDREEGWAIGHTHARAYRALAGVRLVAAADINPANLARFQERFDVPAGYRDYRELLAREQPDLVSICTWVGLHPEMTVAAAEAGVAGILCEKPVALGLEAMDRMARACQAHGARFAMNTQRRFAEPWRTAKALLADGAVGELQAYEAATRGWDLLEWGIHWLDICRFFFDHREAEWVLAQMDASRGLVRFGHQAENDGLVHVGFTGGLRGLFFSGDHAPGFYNRVRGTEGVLEIRGGELRLLGGGGSGGWETITTPAEDGLVPFCRSIQALVEAVDAGADPPHGLASARAATELIMAAYASAVEGRLIELPLAAGDFPLDRLAGDRWAAGRLVEDRPAAGGDPA